MTQVQPLNSTDFLAKNLSALCTFQPQVAELVGRDDSSLTAERTVGRDGCQTFRVRDESGRMRWLGATSMPSISAVELFGNVRRDQGSVLMPGVLSGREPLLVAERLAPFAAVFVIESSPALLGLAFRSYDYDRVIREGRMVFLCGDDLAEAMTAFFAAHPGYEYPGHLFHAPHVAPVDANVLRDAVERAGEVVLTAHATLVQQLQDTIAKQYSSHSHTSTTSRTPRVTLLSVDANEASVKSASRVASAIRTNGWTHNICLPDSPSRCHAAARLKAIAKGTPDIVVFVNSVPKLSRALLPESLPVVSWYLPGFAPVGLDGEHLGRNDLVVASTTAQAQSIRNAGLPCFQVAPAADTAVFSLPAHSTEGHDDGTVAVLADLPQDGAAEMNLTLPSQVALWEALGEETRTAIEHATPMSNSTLLSKAQKRSGTTLSDASLRKMFEQMIATVLRPAYRARACVAALVATGRRVRVYGCGWDRENLPANVFCGSIPDGEDLCEVFRGVQTVVFPVVSDLTIQGVIDALATGAYVVVGANDEALAATYPDLCDAFEYVGTYNIACELATLLPKVGGDRQSDAATLVATKHSCSERLRRIVSKIQAPIESDRALVS